MSKEFNIPKNFGEMIAKASAESTPEAQIRRFLSPESPVTPDPEDGYGYSITRNSIRGKSLFNQERSHAMELVRRLKSDPTLQEELEFWSLQMANMILAENLDFECITCPPSSGKYKPYLAARMMMAIAPLLNLPWCGLFVNNYSAPNKTVHERLRDESKYEFMGDAEDKRNILVIDDCVCTGSTFQKCVDAAGSNTLYFAVLCRS